VITVANKIDDQCLHNEIGLHNDEATRVTQQCSEEDNDDVTQRGAMTKRSLRTHARYLLLRVQEFDFNLIRMELRVDNRSGLANVTSVLSPANRHPARH